METRAGIAGHPIHPMLVTVPIGLWVFSFIADVIYVAGGNAIWSSLAYYTMAGGLVGALIAAVPGAIELFAITSGHTRRIGMWHMSINVLVVTLYGINIGLRTNLAEPALGHILFSGLTIVMLGLSGWLGGEMVYRHGVGVAVHTRET